MAVARWPVIHPPENNYCGGILEIRMSMAPAQRAALTARTVPDMDTHSRTTDLPPMAYSSL